MAPSTWYYCTLLSSAVFVFNQLTWLLACANNFQLNWLHRNYFLAESFLLCNFICDVYNFDHSFFFYFDYFRLKPEQVNFVIDFLIFYFIIKMKRYFSATITYTGDSLYMQRRKNEVNQNEEEEDEAPKWKIATTFSCSVVVSSIDPLPNNAQ